MIADEFGTEDDDFFGEDISWEDAAEDLEKQKDLINEEAGVAAAPEASAETAETTLPPNIDSSRLSMITSIPMKITVELGRSKMLINDLLQLGQGSVIELNKLIGEPLEVMVNDRVIARGEVVVVNEKFGVRLTEVISKAERIENLR